jgi:hypothetical protein
MMTGGGRKTAMAPVIFAALTLAGCGEAEQPPPVAQPPLPTQVCDDARNGLEEISRTGSFEYSADGQATLEEAIWLPMAPAQRDGLAQALAFHAACSAKVPPRETWVTIKNEGGRVLTRRVVETTVDISKILEQ